MSYVIFCKGKRAEKPYLIEDIKMPVYSMEELCYYIYSNVSLCDRELLKPELAAWIERQCGLPDLSESIRVVLQKDPRAERVAAQIFAYANYLTRQERDAVCERIRKYSMLGLNERRKMRGDYFYLGQKYRDAIREYEEMIARGAYDDEKMHHDLLYNIGCCYGSMFYFEIAYGWFLQAAAMDISRGGDMMAALFCKRMSLEDGEWEKYLSEHPDFAAFAPPMEKQREQLLKQWEKTPEGKELLSFQEDPKNRKKEYYAFMSKCLEEWKAANAN